MSIDKRVLVEGYFLQNILINGSLNDNPRQKTEDLLLISLQNDEIKKDDVLCSNKDNKVQSVEAEEI